MGRHLPDHVVVLVGFSTTFQNQGVQIARTLEALAGLPVRVLVPAGPELDLAAFAVPDNARIISSAPHDAVMRDAALVVTHAGHGTTLRALSHGCPLLCLPMGRDQNDNAARVAWHGAGLRLDASADSKAIGEAARALLDEDGYREKAAIMRDGIRAEIAASPLVSELETMAGAAASVQISAAA